MNDNPAPDVRSSEYLDDSSKALGLGHSYRTPVRAADDGTPRDEKGRKVVALPAPERGYRADLVDKSPDELAAQLAAEYDAAGDRWEGTEREMQRVPGGRVPGSHSSGSSGSKLKHKRGGVKSDGGAADEYRPMPAAGRVTRVAYDALMRERGVVGRVLEAAGRALAAGVSVADLESEIETFVARRHKAARAHNE